ncbi:MAG: M48 family metalloprotease [Janthinobacterium lividum]
MTREAFAAELTRLRPLAEANPTAYRRRVQGWALLGYGFLFVLLLGSVGLLGGALWALVAVGFSALLLKLMVPLAFFTWKVVRSLWVQFDPPAGQPLSRAEAAPLLDLLRQQSRQLKAPRVHQILVSSDYNASAVQVPRLGAFGWPRNYVVVGLPLLQTLSPEQAAAVVAHELGHLRSGDSRFSAWVYRVGQSWAQLVGQLAQQNSRSLLHGFTDWYVPRFQAWSHPLRRTAEFEADAAAARLTSPQALAEALCAITVRDAALDRAHWDGIGREMAHAPRPAPDVISRLVAVAKTARLPEADEQRLLHNQTTAAADPFDTHPTLGERLAALGQPAVLPPLPTTTAAEAWFGDHLPQLTQRLDAQWAADRAAPWAERHRHLRTQRERLATLNARLATGETLPDADAWEHADLTEDHAGPAEALPLLQALHASPTWGAAAKFATGRILLAQDDAAGLDPLLESIAQDADLRGPGLAVQQAYYERQGNWAEVQRLSAQQLRHADTMDVVLAERHSIERTDTFTPHDLPTELLDDLRTQLAAPAAGVSRAWLLRKELAHYGTEKPLFVLVLLPSPGTKARPDAQQQAWVQQLANAITLPGEVLVVTGSAYAWLEKRALGMAGSEILLL